MRRERKQKRIHLNECIISKKRKKSFYKRTSTRKRKRFLQDFSRSHTFASGSFLERKTIYLAEEPNSFAAITKWTESPSEGFFFCCSKSVFIIKLLQVHCHWKNGMESWQKKQTFLKFFLRNLLQLSYLFKLYTRNKESRYVMVGKHG